MDLKDFRQEINSIDKEIVHLLNIRFNVAMKIGLYKKDHNLPVLDVDREKELLEKISNDSQPELQNFILNIYAEILRNSRMFQEEML